VEVVVCRREELHHQLVKVDQVVAVAPIPADQDQEELLPALQVILVQQMLNLLQLVGVILVEMEKE
tara:strand:+ start:333 stop:530 length:198 start_codon:yes stop_codon:yes gene_type:complete